MRLPRVMTAAPRSGSGKTIITCGLLQSLRRRGTDVRSYKCGPDYIDPMFHRRVTGVQGGNLDPFFSSDEELRETLGRSGCEAAVIEGVMGIYDGIAGLGGRGSCYDVAKATETPVILVTDVKGMGQTMLSVIKGILADDSSGLIRGIVLNRISSGYCETIAPQMTEMLEDISRSRGIGVNLLGGLPDSKDIHLDSRHLGLNMPGEIEDLKEQVDAAADLIEKHLDMEKLLEIMETAGKGSAGQDAARAEAHPGPEAAFYNETAFSSEIALSLEAALLSEDAPVLAVARDEAFCFYYEENLDVLRDAGIRIVEFSPVHDSGLPDEADGLLLGGGYPELYAEELSCNVPMRASVKQAIENGMPSLAECGGFMYLLETLKDLRGTSWDMAGALNGESYSTGRLNRFGYITIREKKHLCAASTLLTGLSIKGHEFHYFDSDNNGSNAIAERPGSGRKWDCMHAGHDHLWGYPHLWYPSCPQLAERFRDRMTAYRQKNNG